MTISFEEFLAQFGAQNGGSSSAVPFLTGATEAYQVPVNTSSLAGIATASAGGAQAQMPVTATPDSIAIPASESANGQNVSWAALPAYWRQNDRQQYAWLMEQLKAGGFQSWDEFLGEAGYSGKPVWDALAGAVESNAPFYDANAGTGDGPFSTTTTENRSSTDLSSQSEAAGSLEAIFQQELGRLPTEKEVNAFQKALNAEQAKNASVTTGTSTTSGTRSGNNTTQSVTGSTTTTGGFDPGRLAREFAQSRPMWAETQAATTFMKLLDTAVSNPDALSRLVAEA